MKPSPEQIASDWITYALYDPNNAPEEVYARGWVIYDMAQDEPSLAWQAIKLVVSRYAEDDLFSTNQNEAKAVVGNTAAGPLEDLLAAHGPQFVEIVEIAARNDRRMKWALAGLWRNSMSDEVWTRVQKAAGDLSR